MSEAEQVNDREVCPQCGARIELRQIKKYPGNMPLMLTGLGVLGILFFVGALVGIALILGGIYMLTARETVRYCPSCRYCYRKLAGRQDNGETDDR